MNVSEVVHPFSPNISSPEAPPAKESQEKKRPREEVVETVARKTILYWNDFKTDLNYYPRRPQVIDQPVSKERLSQLYFNGCYKAIYEGDVVNDKAHGNGKEICQNGSVYEGDFVYGIRHGKGKLTYGNGNVYEGDFQNGMPHGKGKETGACDGEVSEGDFKYGNLYGKGKITRRDGTLICEGDFVRGKREGKCKATLSDGTVLEGYFYNGAYHEHPKQSNPSLAP